MSPYDCTVHRPVVVAVLLLVGCHRPPQAGGSEREYRFVHLETTGLTSGILVPGSVRRPGQPEGFPDVMIVLSKDSDHDAVQALNSLDYKVLQPNGGARREGDGIVLVGVLDAKARHTPTGPGMAESEPYQEFHLSRWYLRAPFMRRLGVQTPVDDAPPGFQRDDRLRPEDFGNKISGDLSRFVRSR